MDIAKYLALGENNYIKTYGRVVKVVGLTVESTGPEVKINDTCSIYLQGAAKSVLAEVVGFREDRVLLMPYEDVSGVQTGDLVESGGNAFGVPVGDALLGRVLDGLGQPLEGELPPVTSFYNAEAMPPNPMERVMIDEVLPLGVKAVDATLTLGKGQRIGIFAGSGVGKSTLLGMFARNTKADINVIALIGERGREVREFIERDLGEEGVRRSVLVVATSDQPALIRKKRQRLQQQLQNISVTAARMCC